MKQHSYLALLRGINVGGNNIIKMTALKACFEDMGFSEVKTFIQSGNVIFSSPEKDLDIIEKNIEKTLSAEFSYTACVVVVSHEMLKAIVTNAPKGFGTKPDVYRSDVFFVKNQISTKDAVATIPLNKDVDTAHASAHVIYTTKLISKITRSRLSKIISLPFYKSLTIRNWNTTTKLLALMEAGDES